MEISENAFLIAPCGINCSVCMAYLREKNKCPGCRGPDDKKSISRIKCKIKRCGTFQDSESHFCFECDSFPCARLKRLDKRYRDKYYTSLVGNLKTIQESGIELFLQNEKSKWTCSKCGGTICMHEGYCYSCKEPYEK
ncbi:MAG: hypothetical protein PWQ51_1617 [Methanolobus sp.]|jgi:hypothetical protein|uniref:DUF3795 domain-containing protein n=1 Tax=unclassified Methanolobus TaxID=2629569 RepID=UPI0024AA5ABB|nr:DUF3795 domain-containing protein [Methanolobus sp.]MDI3485317.1 hypothetical protein [Methanolobus sp.]MDK2830720.1 hypothetical protein [Methanolobus sp.]MDK2939453.1 hypothetical protein [Methanolobus sp.]